MTRHNTRHPSLLQLCQCDCKVFCGANMSGAGFQYVQAVLVWHVQSESITDLSPTRRLQEPPALRRPLLRSLTFSHSGTTMETDQRMYIFKNNIYSRFRYFLCLLNRIVQTCAYPTMERYHNYDILYSKHDYKKVVKHMHDELHTSTWLKA